MRLQLKSTTAGIHLLSALLLIVAHILKCTSAGQDAVSVAINKSNNTAVTADTTAASSSQQPAKMEEKILLKNSAHEKIPPEQLECFAEYLIKVKNAKTEIFAEKVEKFKWFFTKKPEKPSWRVKRAIEREQKMEEWRVYESEMAEHMGEHQAEECFTRNREVLSIEHATKEQKKKPVKFFVRIPDLFDRSANGHLQVSDDLYNKLEEQSKCLVEFMIENFGVDHLHEEGLEEVHRQMVHDHVEQNNNSAFAVLEAHSVNGATKKLSRWKWGEKKARQIFEEIHFKEHTQQFNALAECFQMVPFENSIWEDETGKPFLTLKPLLARFHDDQLFVIEPKTRNNFTLGHIQLNVLKQKERTECSICLGHFEVDHQLQQIYPCRHLFHRSCIDKWLKDHEDCPLCRGVANPTQHTATVLTASDPAFLQLHGGLFNLMMK